MITLNDIKKSFEEQEFPYEEQENLIIVQNFTLGNESVPAFVVISCEEHFEITCSIEEPIKISLNENVVKVVNSLNQRLNFFQFYAEEEGKEKCDLIVHYSVPAKYLADPEIGAEMLVRSLKVMDDFYSEVMRVKWAK